MCPFYSAGSTWSYWSSRACWSSWSCCKFADLVRYSDKLEPRLGYVSASNMCISWLWPLYLSHCAGCRWWARSQRSAGSVWTEGRWRSKRIPWTSRPSGAAGVDYNTKYKPWLNVSIKKHWGNMINPSARFSGFTRSTWWERWNWRRWSNGKSLLNNWYVSTIQLTLLLFNTFHCKQYTSKMCFFKLSLLFS